ncbi:MAG: hypothetical protein IAF58_12390 [Leptolyngbya sp.]|nr:hypothetical protein [Candidatus Melainabacteria bacterium]
MFDKLTDEAINIFMLAQEEALTMRHSTVGSEHILLALLAEQDTIVRSILLGCGLSPEVVRAQVENISPQSGKNEIQALPLNQSATRILELSWDVVESLGAKVVCPEHLLLALLQSSKSSAIELLNNSGVNRQLLRREVISAIEGTAGFVGDDAIESSIAPTESQLVRLSGDGEFLDFDDDAVKAIMFAHDECRRMGISVLGVEQILLGVLALRGITFDCFAAMRVNRSDLRIALDRILGSGAELIGEQIPNSAEANFIFELAAVHANNFSSEKVSPEHLALGILDDPTRVILDALYSLGVNINQLQEDILVMMTE